MKRIIEFIKADFESFVYGLKNDSLGYDLGDFLRYWRAKKNKRRIARKFNLVRPSIFAKR